ncbi:MAG TPA: GNAT family protein [Herpetosiphonaceae bacterium]|nr:GNAT family protein [Herpetosiphonaceae bacterium]
MPEELILRGVQVCLRDWRLDDLAPLEHWIQPGREWKRWDAPYYPEFTPAEAADYVERKRRAIERADLPAARMNAAIARAGSDELIGMVNAYWESIETLWLTLGIVIYDPAAWGRGAGSEAFGLWTGYQFAARPEIVRLDLRTWSGNYGMIRVAQKLGFQEEACFRNARIVDGTFYDSLAYGILREEWERAEPPARP